MPDPKPIRIFLASPGDVTAERQIVMEIIDELKRSPILGKNDLELVAWDDPTDPLPMLAQYTPQEIVAMGKPLPADCQIVVVIFWARMGTPLDVDRFGLKPDGSPYWSGTEWEYLNAMQGAEDDGLPLILLYRRTETPSLLLDDPDVTSKVEQYQRVKDFFNGLTDPETGAIRQSYTGYATVDEFREKATADIGHWVGNILRNDLPPRPQPRKVKTEPYTGEPYPGLVALNPAQAAIFFGRGEETQRLIDRLRASRFVGVVGASGSGKSSLVGAGLIPWLRRGAIDGSRDWLLPGYDLEAQSWSGVRFTPAENPFRSLAGRLAPLLKKPEARLTQELEQNADDPAHLLEPLFAGKPASCELLLFIDQFEELLTLSHENQREPFARLLAAFARHRRLRTVVTLRADFLDACLNVKPLEPLLTETINVGPPSPIALMQMVAGPATEVGLHFEPEILPERIALDTGNEKGGLALLAYALAQLYTGREGDRLTQTVYDSFGGVQKAIGSKAQAVYDSLDAEAQAALTPLFGQLVTVNRVGEPTRKRAFITALVADTAASGVRELLNRLIEERLLVTDQTANGATVDVAHEALFLHWPALVEWIDRFKGDIYLLEEVRRRAQEWDRRGRPIWYPRYRHEDEKQILAAAAKLSQPFTDVEQAYLQPELDRLAEQFRRVKYPAYKQREVLERLLTIGAETVPTLFHLLDDVADDEIADTITHALDYWNVESNPFAQEGLVADFWLIRAWAAGRCGVLADREALPRLCDLLGDSKSDVRWVAIQALARLGDRKALPCVIKLLGDPEMRVREAAIQALAGLADQEAVPLMIDLLSDPDSGVREAAIRVLAGLADQEAVPLMIDLLSDPDSGVRGAASQALTGLADREALPRLIDLLGDPDNGVRRVAMRAFAALADQEALPRMIELLDDPDNGVRRAAIQGLSRLAGREALPRLRDLLDDRDGGVRRAAIQALTNLADREALPRMIELLGDLDWYVREEALQALVRLTDREALPRLRDLLDDPESNVRQAAIQALGELADREAQQRLRDLLSNPDKHIRQAAIQALAGLGDVAVLPVLLLLLNDEDYEVRQDAIEALLRLEGRADQLPMTYRLFTDAYRTLAAQVLHN